MTFKDGRQKKSVPFNDFRKELDIEQERQRIREPNLAKKRKPPLAVPEAPGAEKRPKRSAARKPAIVEDENDFFSQEDKKSPAKPLAVKKPEPKMTSKPKPEPPRSFIFRKIEINEIRF